MTYTLDDYDPPLKGHLDARQLALFADNQGIEWAFHSKMSGDRLRVFVELDGRVMGEAENVDHQTALDEAIAIAIAAVSGQPPLPLGGRHL